MAVTGQVDKSSIVMYSLVTRERLWHTYLDEEVKYARYVPDPWS